jgi:hypothetical protein
MASRPAVVGLRENAEAVMRESVAEVHLLQPSLRCEGKAVEVSPRRSSWARLAMLR